MSLLGETRQDFPFSVCSKFQPAVLEGQLCYSLDLSLLETKNTKPGLDFELLLLIDPGRPYYDWKEEVAIKNKANTLSLKPLGDVGSFARVYLNTLSSFTDYRNGSYLMSDLKKMTGTKDFLKLSSESKNCQLKTLEDCQTQRYVEEVQNQCGCLPWAIRSAVQRKVIPC